MPPEGLLRSRDAEEHARVTNVELFFDLVFVLAVTQISHSLLGDFTPMGALRTALLFLAVWWAWINTAWFTNWIDPDRGPARLLLFGMMFAGLVLSIAIPDAFGAKGLHFALAYVTMELSRSLFMLWALRRDDAALRLNFLRILCWQILAAPFWVAGGLAEGGGWRLGLWILALAVWSVAPVLGFGVPGLGRSTTRDWQVEGGHLAERCGLFIIIVLGESILVTGATFGTLDWTPATIGAFATAFTGSVALWWVYFHIGAELGSRRIQESGNPGRLARLGYTYLHIPIVAGIVVGAVADERVLHHPDGHAGWGDAAVILGGPALYLGGLSLFKRLSLSHPPLSHSLGLGMLLLLALASPLLSPLALSALATAVLIFVAAWEHQSLGRRIA